VGATADMSATGAAADMSATGAAAGMSATGAAAGMSATAAAAAMTATAAAVTAATCRKSHAWADVFFIEDVKGRQADVREFLLGENNSPRIVLRRLCRCGRSCRGAADHRHGYSGRAQRQGCFPTVPFSISLRPRHLASP
jgi:hypothetical protein